MKRVTRYYRQYTGRDSLVGIWARWNQNNLFSALNRFSITKLFNKKNDFLSPYFPLRAAIVDYLPLARKTLAMLLRELTLQMQMQPLRQMWRPESGRLQATRPPAAKDSDMGDMN
jgi:hypothetical protein